MSDRFSGIFVNCIPSASSSACWIFRISSTVAPDAAYASAICPKSSCLMPLPTSTTSTPNVSNELINPATSQLTSLPKTLLASINENS